VRSRRILGGPLKGRRIVTSWHDYPAALLGTTERALVGWFDAHATAGETWLDIGAHYGYTSMALCLRVGAAGRVFAFEPMVATAGHLTGTRVENGLTQLTILPLALAAPIDIARQQLAVSRGMADQTLDGGGWQETLLVARLDWLWPRICGDNARIDGIKIDVQGMELEVLRGMMETLRAWQPQLVVELHRGVDRQEVLRCLEAAGYGTEAIPIEPVDGETVARLLDDRSYAFRPRAPVSST
jgi:FkbM family methyltransferase